MTPLLELVGIAKRFGSVVALDGADFVLGPGEIHGLLGENGAGKSTLMHLVFGLHLPDAGQIRVRGERRSIRSPRDAKALGIGMVHQHFTSVPALTVRENLWLAAGRHGAAVGDPPEAQVAGTAAERLRARLWAGLDPGAPADGLPVGAKQRLEILQALATGADILLLDEPTAVLAPPEVRELLALLREFADSGGSAVLITHKLDEVMSAVDRVTVLRRGRVTLSGPISAESPASLAAAMVGAAAVGELAPPERPAVATTSNDDAPVVSGGGLEVRRGEIVGIVAVEGNGQRELLRAVAGVGPRSGPMRVVEPVAFIPEDRTTEGLIPNFSLAENLVLGLPNDDRWSRGPWLDWSAATIRMTALLPEFGIRAAGAEAPARSLSGGNQQKVVFARALEARPAVLVAENPTRGLDVHATRFVHDRLRAAAASGVGVLLYSADLDEVLSVADRVVVMARGSVIPVPSGADRERVGALMLGAAE